MTQNLGKHRHFLVVGLGATGLSCVRFLRGRGERVLVTDSREAPPGLDALKNEFPDLSVATGGFDREMLAVADVLVMSPGVPLSTPEIAEVIAEGTAVASDIALFREAFAGRLAVITGSNAKSTVTAWLADMAERAGAAYVVGGNLGEPALNLLDRDAELAILELSSFQLELVPALHADVAAMLNLSADHMDRYPSLEAYASAKQRIFQGCKLALYNRNDAQTGPRVAVDAMRSFGLDAPTGNNAGVIDHDGERWLALGQQPWLAASQVSLPGRHNLENALATLAMGEALGFDTDAMLDSLRQFKGLPHRCEPVAEKAGIRFINDSKGTNVGATLAAVEGLGRDAAGKLILLLGGQAKDGDFTPLQAAIDAYCKAVYVYGEDAPGIAAALGERVTRVDTLEAALSAAVAVAKPGDTVLLSPACASFDQFRNFEHRGDVFRQWVEGWS
ncbi:MAG: UDP-N-acetylmuramoyl-L-alanine--D-glutamate ligase [Saccharospirillum sp.]